MIESATGSLDTLSADRTAGHSSGYDLVIIDETGLFPLRARELLAGLRSSVSARNGAIRHISIRGDSILFREILENPAVVSHVHAAPAECNIDDEAAWRAANPGLGTIKSIAYMKNEVERVAGVPSDEPSFRAYDLNLALSPTREAVCTPGDLEACFVDVAEYRGPVYVGLDIGEASSGTAAVAYWPETGALKSWLAFGDVPDLGARGRRDGADYSAMERRGELRTYPGRTVPVDVFVLQVEADLDGAEVRTAVADGYRCGELLDVCPWPLEIVRSGTGPSLSIKASEQRSRLGELGALEELTLELRTELDTLSTAHTDTEAQLRAAIAADGDATQAGDPTVDPEVRERLELRGRASFGRYLHAALTGAQISGAEAEFQSACGVPGIPLDLFEQDRPVEVRADAASGLPATGAGATLAPIQPYVFAQSIAPMLGIDMPSVGSGAYSEMTISTALTAAAKAKGTKQESTAAVLTATTATPRSIRARLTLNLEDIAAIGQANFEAALRENAGAALSDGLDNQAITGDGQPPNIAELVDRSAP